MISANTNLMALRLQTSLENNTNYVSKALERMSTGFKINRASDDAAGYFVATNLTSQIRGLGVANKNIADGLSMLQTAEGSLNNLANMLLRVRDLSLMCANGIYTDSQLVSVQEEINQLSDEITRIKNSCEFNGKNIFGTQKTLDKNQIYVDSATATTFGSKSQLAKTINTTTLNNAPNLSNWKVGDTSSSSDAKKLLNQVEESLTNINETLKAGVTPYATGDIEKGSFDYVQGITKVIGGKTYTFQNYNGPADKVNWEWNKLTDEITLDCKGMAVTAAVGQKDNLIINSKATRVIANDMDDKIVVNGADCNIYGGTGDDTVIMNSGATNTSVRGEAGDDTIIFNSSNCIGDGNAGNDTFIYNGDENWASGNEGNDNFIINSGKNNSANGADGDNTITDKGENTVSIAMKDKPDMIPLSGIIRLSATSFQTLNLFGKTYSIKGEKLSYSYNETTKELTLNLIGTAINAPDDQENNLILYGANITLNLGSKNDKIVVNGSASTINSGGGDDEIIINSTNNTIKSGGGNDKITVNGNNNCIKDSEGTNTITVNAGKTNNIINSGGNTSNTIIDNGLNTGIMNTPGQDKTLPPSGLIYLEVGESETITIAGKTYTIENINLTLNLKFFYSYDALTDMITMGNSSDLGRDLMKITAKNGQEDNIILTDAGTQLYTGDGNDKIIQMGAYQKIYAGEGDDEIIRSKLSYNKNDVDSGAGNDKISVEGNENIINGGDGNDEFTILSGDSNTVNGGTGYDTVSNYGTNTTLININTLFKNADPLRLQVGFDSSSNSSVTVELGMILQITDFNVSSAAQSLKTVENVDELLKTVNSKRADIGAYSSRLNSAINSNTTSIENLSAAKSTIMDADMAEESANFVKYQILQNTTATLLSQTNKLPQNLILKLVG